MDTDAKIAELKEATREANGILGDLKRVKREMELFEREVTKKLEATVDDILGVHVERGLNQYKAAQQKAINESTDAVIARFDQLAELLLEDIKKVKPSIPELVQALKTMKAWAEND